MTFAASMAVGQTPYLWYTVYDAPGATTTRSLRSVALSPAESVLYTGWIQGSSTRAIRLVDPGNGNVLATTNVGSSAFNALATDDRGFVYAARGSTSTSLVIYDATTATALGSVGTGNSNNNGVSVYKDGSTYYAYVSVASALRRYDVTDETNPTLDTAWASSGILSGFGVTLRGIHVDDSGVIYATSRDTNEVFRVSAGTSPAVTTVGTDVTRPMDVFSHGGHVYAVAYDGVNSLVAQLDPVTLDLVAELTTGIPRGANEGFASVVATGGGELYVADQFYAGTSSVMSDRVLLGTPNEKTFSVASGVTTLTALLAGDGGVVKAGAGTLVLTADNLYTGPTTVEAGTLRVDGDQSAATGAVTVAQGAVLSGTGTVGGATAVLGSHAPGASPGLQTFAAGLTYESDSTFVWELIENTADIAARGTEFDAVDVTGGTLVIEAAVNSTLVFDGVGSSVDWTDPFWASDRSWLVFQNASTPVGNFDNARITVGLDAQGASLAAVHPTAGFSWAVDGDDIVLHYATTAPDTPTPTEVPDTPTSTPIIDTPTPTMTPTAADTATPTSTPTPTDPPATPTPAPPATFSFAGFAWDQADTPDVILTLAPGSVDGAIVTSVPFEATGNIGAGFPEDPAGFDASLTLGRMLHLSATGVRAVNLPAGNDGTQHRSGFQVSWSGGRKLQNLPGYDFVVYESASNSSTPEAFMVQAFDLAEGAWTPWYYKPVDGFQVYNGSANAGATATGFDLSDLGVAEGVAIDRIRLVNMTHLDRMVDPSRVGFVLPEDNGANSTFLPDPGPSASFSFYGASTLDPDPLYIAALHSVESAACGNGVVEPGAGEQCDPGPDVPNDCCDANCQFIADATPCDDDDFCTIDNVCSSGVCAGTPRDCSDGNACTADSCDSDAETCVNDAAAMDGAGCDDGLFCTVADTCAGGVCSGVANPCDDGNDCTFDTCDEGTAQCLHDASLLDGALCDDEDPCTASSACSAGVCSGADLILVCGDGLVCGPEQCDDGNSDENDGCSSQCEIEQELVRRQQICINSMNLAVSRVADIQGRVSTGCVRDGGLGRVGDAQTCVELDVRGRVAANQARAQRLEERQCTIEPPFGKGDLSAATEAARDEAVALVADVFGADLQAAVISRAEDRPASVCQQLVAERYERLASMARREFFNCKASRFKAGAIRSRAGLEACFDVWNSDPTGRLFKTRQRLERTISDRCAGVDLAEAFPGNCALRVDLGACLDEQVLCRLCRTFNVADALDGDCDWMDDGQVNGSCP